MFRLSKQADYAIQLLHRLSSLDKNKALSLRTFSDESNISFLFLQRIARELKQAKMIESKQGVQGGYFLIKKYADISLMDVIKAIDKPVFAPCVIDEKTCKLIHTCTTKAGIERVQKKMIALLKATPIAGLTS
ncbi:MAG: hypothetical protein CO030_03990 [Candidatus Magasanikbacteria bacterium CG_4_9_14_0_2_um_filter_42_11]|uniref:Rrf2 family transcriptional regulator n=1 Tax=Candidatus Magasanikbacteria bacterium CG_4_9_14_0_2_um_filter_42_11 TaxID=1974643 RepID=A0A2M8F952_9BACT|nr:MAG: hypothetical protein COU34_04205 [Candidatus Magasanikbacteria bacterium CG10_big_fil_rev_8_21_14_0_10_43_9]PIY92245.1 MAG: hypothetical protein COY70_04310 [Candidatus Magasanikbacteria bacterium CG_4_10_14_0_8_um_filter_42_12]PJC52252.1 MAG: hypothetical protein CO030_03990 [Candidatus Magasanikbacteria bacterium CG_4_9_14_0_2_um_filter_42_11]